MPAAVSGAWESDRRLHQIHSLSVGQVAISSKRHREGLKALFCSSGPEISNDDLPFIFERFFRTDRSRARDTRGSGLGLAITRESIEAHGDRIGANSRDGRTCIWFTLPA